MVTVHQTDSATYHDGVRLLEVQDGAGAVDQIVVRPHLHNQVQRPLQRATRIFSPYKSNFQWLQKKEEYKKYSIEGSCQSRKNV